jgi:hypothetical protein
MDYAFYFFSSRSPADTRAFVQHLGYNVGKLVFFKFNLIFLRLIPRVRDRPRPSATTLRLRLKWTSPLLPSPTRESSPQAHSEADFASLRTQTSRLLYQTDSESSAPRLLFSLPLSPLLTHKSICPSTWSIARSSSPFFVNFTSPNYRVDSSSPEFGTTTACTCQLVSSINFFTRLISS